MDYEQKYKEALDRAKDVPTFAWKSEEQMLSYIFPELAESEDERIRKWLSDILDAFCWRKDWPYTKQQVINYLEKQKEYPMPNSTKLIEMWDAEKEMLKEKDFRDDAWRLAYNAFLDGFARGTCVKPEKQKEQKPIQDETEREYVRTLKSLISDFLRGKEEVDREYYQRIYDWLDGRHIEQKPIQGMEEEEFVCTIKKLDPNVVIETCTDGTGELDGKALLYTADKSYQIGFRDGFRKGVEAVKPVDWSESFEENIRILLHDKLTWHSEDGKMSSTVFIDDKTLKDIVSGIWFYVGKEALKYPNKELNVSEWSEEDEEMRKACIAFISEDVFKKYEKSYECIDWLKSLRPHWKPSEEQMEALQIAAMESKTDFETLTSLLVELKKLM